MSENELHDVLAQALSDSAPDPQVMANAAAAHGRVLRRRRTMLQVAGSTAAVVLVAGGIGVGLSHGGSGDSTLVAPAGGGGKAKATPTGPATPTAPAPTVSFSSNLPTVSPTTGADGNNGQWGAPLTADRIATHTPYADLLASLIPGSFTKTTAGINPKGSSDGRVLINDGKGGSLLKVAVDWSGQSTTNLNDCTNSGFSTVTDCQQLTINGVTVRVEKIDGEPDAQQHGVFYWGADLSFKDGMYIHLSERNTDRDGNPPTRVEAPLSLDQLAQIAADPQWDTLIKQHPANS